LRKHPTLMARTTSGSAGGGRGTGQPLGLDSGFRQNDVYTSHPRMLYRHSCESRNPGPQFAFHSALRNGQPYHQTEIAQGMHRGLPLRKPMAPMAWIIGAKVSFPPCPQPRYCPPPRLGRGRSRTTPTMRAAWLSGAVQDLPLLEPNNHNALNCRGGVDKTRPSFQSFYAELPPAGP